MHFRWIAIATLLLGGCATTSDENERVVDAQAPPPERPAEPLGDPPPRPPEPGEVTYASEMAILNELVRAMGQQQAGGVVLMHGLGFETLPDVDWSRTPLAEALAEIRQKGDLYQQQRGYYAFLYPKGYEPLLKIDTSTKISPAFRRRSARMTMGDGTFMSSALALLSHSVGRTIVADNAVGAARTGELALPTAPVTVVLDALLQSARVVMNGLVIEATDDYLFLRTDREQQQTLLNAGSLTPEQQTWLNERVTVYLPSEPINAGRLPVSAELTTLSDMLPALRRQLGANIEIGAQLEELPVSQAAFIDLPRRDVLDLLIRQWLLPRFGYRMTEAGVEIVQR